MLRYPEAEWVPWRFDNPETGAMTYYKDANKPIAVVLHTMEGYATTARQWATEGHYGASWHFTVARDGRVMQHLDFEDGGYHAGVRDAQAREIPPTWPLWKGLRKNVNHYTIGVEHEGFAANGGWPDVQREASKRLLNWLAGALGIPRPAEDAMVVGAEGPGARYLLHYPPHAAIDRINRPNDFASPPARAAFYTWLKEGEEMTAEQEAMLQELWRRTGGDAGRNFDLLLSIQNQQKALTKHIDEHPDGDGIPEHRHTMTSINITGGIQK